MRRRSIPDRSGRPAVLLFLNSRSLLVNGYEVPPVKRFLNAMVFPYRALFMHHGFGGFITSMEEDRMIRVARYCKGRVLDVGCGPYNKFIKNVYPDGIGVDFHPYKGVEIVLDDPTHLPYDSESFDTVTLNAVGGHIPKQLREVEFKELARLLRTGGRLIMTEGEPITQYLHHKWVFMLGKVFGAECDVDTERGMKDGEEYCMPQKEIRRLFRISGLNHIVTERFQWHLNNVFVAEKLGSPGETAVGA